MPLVPPDGGNAFLVGEPATPGLLASLPTGEFLANLPPGDFTTFPPGDLTNED